MMLELQHKNQMLDALTSTQKSNASELKQCSDLNPKTYANEVKLKQWSNCNTKSNASETETTLLT